MKKLEITWRQRLKLYTMCFGPTQGAQVDTVLDLREMIRPPEADQEKLGWTEETNEAQGMMWVKVDEGHNDTPAPLELPDGMFNTLWQMAQRAVFNLGVKSEVELWKILQCNSRNEKES